MKQKCNQFYIQNVRVAVHGVAQHVCRKYSLASGHHQSNDPRLWHSQVGSSEYLKWGSGLRGSDDRWWPPRYSTFLHLRNIQTFLLDC